VSESWVQRFEREHPAEMAEARARFARAVERPCSEGNCVESYDPQTCEVIGGWGPVGCPCESPRWRRWWDRKRWARRHGGAR